MKNLKLIFSLVGAFFVSLGAMYLKGRKDSTQAHRNKELEEENAKQDIIIKSINSKRSLRQNNKII